MYNVEYYQHYKNHTEIIFSMKINKYVKNGMFLTKPTLWQISVKSFVV